MIMVDCRHSRYCRPAGDGVQDQDGACQADEESSLLSDMQQCQQPKAALCCSCSCPMHDAVCTVADNLTSDRTRSSSQLHVNSAAMIWQCLLITAGLLSVNASSALVIDSIDVEIDLKSQLTIYTEKIAFRNAGSEPVTSVVLCQTQEHAAREAHLEVTQGDDREAPELEVIAGAAAPSNWSCVDVQLQQAIQPGQTELLERYAVYTDLQRPLPAQIGQADSQKVLFEGSHLAPAAYPVKKQTTKVRLASAKVVSHSQLAPTKRQGKVITFGPYTDAPAFTEDRMHVHFENNSPFLHATRLVREIEVSHWGNVYVEERYYIRHTGAKHKGAWSRLDLQSNPGGYARAAITKLTGTIPAAAHATYYRDEIGNISSSNIRYGVRTAFVELKPRFPLFGGWQTEFTFGYSLPLPSIVSRLADGRLRLKTDFSTPFESMVVDDLTVKVVLPEGAFSIQADVPFAVEESRDTKYTYLDTAGRPVVVLKKQSAVPEHQQPFTVTYAFSRAKLLHEPALLVSSFAVLFASALLWVRCDFRITKDEKWRRAREQEETTALLQRIAAVVAERRKALQTLTQHPGSSNVTIRQLEQSAIKLDQLEREFGRLGSAGSRSAAVAQLITKEKEVQQSAVKLHSQQEQLGPQEASAKLGSQVRVLEEQKSEAASLLARLLQAS